jgi:hypothetical protein
MLLVQHTIAFLIKICFQNAVPVLKTSTVRTDYFEYSSRRKSDLFES